MPRGRRTGRGRGPSSSSRSSGLVARSAPYSAAGHRRLTRSNIAPFSSAVTVGPVTTSYTPAVGTSSAPLVSSGVLSSAHLASLQTSAPMSTLLSSSAPATITSSAPVTAVSTSWSIQLSSSPPTTQTVPTHPYVPGPLPVMSTSIAPVTTSAATVVASQG